MTNATTASDTSGLPEEQSTPFLDVRATAALMGISTDTAYTAIARGEIPSIRVGKSIRVPTAALRRMASLDE